MSKSESEGQVLVGDEFTSVGARKIEPCTCGESECVRIGKDIEVAVLVDPELVEHHLKDAETCCEEEHPIAFPVFLNAADARALAAKLLELADAADPHSKN